MNCILGHRFLAVSNRYQRYSVARPMQLLRLLLVLSKLSLVLSQNATSFHFPTFTTSDSHDLLLRGDAALMANSSSIWLNLSNGSVADHGTSCGALLYANPVQFRSWSSNMSTPAVASFQTSFTFTMRGVNSGGFAFTLTACNGNGGSSIGGSMCLLGSLPNGDPNNHFLAVEFDTWKNPEFGDPSDNHVGVNLNGMNSTAIFNFCDEGIDSCNFFVTGQNFTAWVDYEAEMQTLEVRLAVGNAVTKPVTPLILLPDLDIGAVVEDYMWVGFHGSQSWYREVHEVKAWSFATGKFSFCPSKHQQFLMTQFMALLTVLSAACAALIVAAVVLHRVLHGQWDCIKCDFTHVKVMPDKRNTDREF